MSREAAAGQLLGTLNAGGATSLARVADPALLRQPLPGTPGDGAGASGNAGGGGSGGAAVAEGFTGQGAAAAAPQQASGAAAPAGVALSGVGGGAGAAAAPRGAASKPVWNVTCPPAGFNSLRPFDLAAFVGRPWYAQLMVRAAAGPLAVMADAQTRGGPARMSGRARCQLAVAAHRRGQ